MFLKAAQRGQIAQIQWGAGKVTPSAGLDDQNRLQMSSSAKPLGPLLDLALIKVLVNQISLVDAVESDLNVFLNYLLFLFWRPTPIHFIV